MKTPREVLLARHQAAEKKLDAVRAQALAAIVAGGKKRGAHAAIVEGPLRPDPLLQQPLSITLPLLFTPLRAFGRHAAALAALWMLIAVMKFSTPAGPERPTAQVVRPTPEMRLAFAEKRRLMAELSDAPAEPAAEAPKTFIPRPRSERRTEFVAV